MGGFSTIGGARIPIVADDQTAAGISSAQQHMEGLKGSAGSTFNAFHSQSQQSLASVKLLSQELGVHVPKALAKVLAHSEILGPMLAMAFAPAAAAGFFTILESGVEKIREASTTMGGFGEELKKADEKIVEMNKHLLTTFDDNARGMTTVLQLNAALAELSSRRNKLDSGSISTMTWRSAIPGVGGLWDAYHKGQERLGVSTEEAKQVDLLNSVLTRLTENNKKSAEAAKKTSSNIGELSTKMVDLADSTNKFLLKGDALKDKIRDIDEYIRKWNELIEPGTINPSANEKINALMAERAKVMKELQSVGTMDWQPYRDAMNTTLGKQADEFAGLPSTATPKLYDATRKLPYDWTVKTTTGMQAMIGVTNALNNSFDNMFQDIELGTRSMSQWFQSMASSVVAELGRIIVKMTIVAIMQKVIGFALGGMTSIGSAGSSPIGAGTTGQWTGFGSGIGSGGTLIPPMFGNVTSFGGGLAKAVSPVVNVINQTSTPVTASPGAFSTDTMGNFVTSVVLKDASTNGPISQAFNPRR